MLFFATMDFYLDQIWEVNLGRLQNSRLNTEYLFVQKIQKSFLGNLESASATCKGQLIKDFLLSSTSSKKRKKQFDHSTVK